MSKNIDTSHRVGFTVSKDTYEELFITSEELPDEVGRSNNKLGRLVRQYLQNPSEVDVTEVETDEGRPYTRNVGLYVNADEWVDLRTAFEGTDLSEDYKGEKCQYGNTQFSQFCMLVVLARMDD